MEFIIYIAACIYIISQICTALGITWTKIKNIIIWISNIFRFDVKETKRKDKINARAKKYAKKNGLSLKEVETQLLVLIEEKEQERIALKEKKVELKQRKKLEGIIGK